MTSVRDMLKRLRRVEQKTRIAIRTERAPGALLDVATMSMAELKAAALDHAMKLDAAGHSELAALMRNVAGDGLTDAERGRFQQLIGGRS